MTNHSLPLSRFSEPSTLRFGLWTALVLAEFHIISSYIDVKAFIDVYIPNNGISEYVLKTVFRWGLLCLAGLALLCWSKRASVTEEWNDIAFDAANTTAIGINFGLLTSFVAICLISASESRTVEGLSWPLLTALAAICLGIIGSLISILVPVPKLCALLWRWRTRVVLSIGIGTFVIGIAVSKGLLWSGDLLAGATLHLSSAMMHLYEPAVTVNVADRTITVGDFTALIGASCSGMEGIALVTVFVSLYLWVFRHALSFPKVLLLYPIGYAASFVLNSVRIASLTSIGAHISPEMAVQGFHSRAGWITFLVVTLGLMAISLGFTGRKKELATGGAAPARYTEGTTYLLPFVALMIGTLVVSATAPLHYPVYVFKVAIVTFALWSMRHTFAIWRPQISTEALGGGLFIGIIWIATQPATASGHALGVWLAELGPFLATLWLVARGFGTIVLVPIAEELAFRGYLYRRIISPDFFQVQPTHLSWLALGASSMLFGLLHNRWELGVLAGVVFALVMLRRGRLGDAITAHAFANALIFFWALAFQQWSLL